LPTPNADALDRAIAGARGALESGEETASAWHDLGVLYQRRGRLDESLRAFERATACDPGLASAHNNLGNTRAMLGDHALAVESYRQALAIDPSLPAAHANAAVALHVLGRNGEALEHARSAVALAPEMTATRLTAALIEGEVSGYDAALERIDALLADVPDDAGVVSARAYVLLRLERFADAYATAQAGLARRADNGPLLESLGCALRGLGRFEEAFAAFDRAYALGHDRAQILVLKASGLLEIGDFPAARSALDEALALAPHNAQAWSALAEVHAFVAGDPLIAQMEELLDASPAMRANEPRTTMHFALGKAYHRSRDRAGAFRHFRRGNALKRASFAYDAADDEAFARETSAAFTREHIVRLAAAGDRTRAPIFVIGMPRSGTSLVEQILASHPAVFGAGELTAFDDAVVALGRENVAAIAARYAERVDALAPAGQRVVDKMPANFRHAGLIAAAFPGARIVHCMRDPLDTCFSIYTTLFTGRQLFAFDLVEIGRYYRAYAALMEHWRAVLPAGTMLDVRYEDVVTDLEGSARRMLAFCDLPWDARVLRYYETARPVRTASFRQVRNPIYSSSVGSSRAYAAELEPLIALLSR
jgi:tetratricopeptide (TPR) repeat protein